MNDIADIDAASPKAAEKLESVGYDFSERIRDYWRQRGYTVSVGLRRVSEPSPTGKGTVNYSAVRSDMINGLPRGYRGELGK